LSDTIDTSAAEAWMSGNMDKAQTLNQPIPDAPIESGDAAAPFWAHAPIKPMAEAPRAEPTMVDSAIAKLNDIGGEHAALVQKWQTTGANVAEEIGYAKQAFEYVVKERPDLIAKFDQSGLGDDPSVLEFLAQHGRLRAGFMGDFTVAQNNSRSTGEPQRAMPRGQSAAQAELNRIFEETPPGTAGYAKPSVQRRISQLQEMIHGDGPAVGFAGRTA
jgi:hypothetical protein